MRYYYDEEKGWDRPWRTLNDKEGRCALFLALLSKHTAGQQKAPQQQSLAGTSTECGGDGQRLRDRRRAGPNVEKHLMRDHDSENSTLSFASRSLYRKSQGLCSILTSLTRAPGFTPAPAGTSPRQRIIL